MVKSKSCFVKKNNKMYLQHFKSMMWNKLLLFYITAI